MAHAQVWSAIVIFVALAGAAGSIATAATPVSLSLVAKESGCGAGKTFCFEVNGGKLSDIAPGSTVTVAFQNAGIEEHEVLATVAAKVDTAHKATPEEGKLGGVEDVAPGDNGTMTFVVPMDATGVYFWCGKPDHEERGMWLEASFGSAKHNSSGAGVFLVLVTAGLAVAWRRRAA